MKKILIGVVLAVVIAAIAFVARSQFANSSAVAAPAVSSEASPTEARGRAAEGSDGDGVDASSARSERAAADGAVGVAEARGADGEGGAGGDAESATREAGAAPDGEESRGAVSPADGRTGERLAAAEGSDARTERGSPSGSDAEPARGTEGPSGGSDARTSGDRTASRAVQMPSPDTILERAAAAYENVRSLQAEFVQRLENTLLGTTATSRGTIYQRRPDRFLMRFTEPAGDMIVGDGDHFWIYYPSVDRRQVIRTPMGAGGAGGVDLQAQFLGDPTERFDATLEGIESVDARDAHVLTLDPKEPLGYEELKVWVDTRDHLVRRFEIREPNGVIRRVELNGLTVNPALADSLFEFTPPEGARVVDRG